MNFIKTLNQLNAINLVKKAAAISQEIVFFSLRT